MGQSSEHDARVAAAAGGTSPSTAADPPTRPPEVMIPEHRDMVLVGLKAVSHGDIASDDEVEATLARYRL